MTRLRLAATLIFVASWGSAVLAQGHGRETYAGPPAGIAVQVLQNPGFLVGYSHEHRQPLWVAYRAESLKKRRLGKRPERFEPDPRVASAITADAYRGSGYTRGHLAPNYLIGKLYGRAAQHATFLMTNIAPQSEALNQLVWQRLEEAEADVVAPGAVELWVVAGPLFPSRPERLRRAPVAVPDAFYRIWLDVRADGLRALAFAVPQDVCGDEPLSRFLTTIDAIEARTGLDFFHELEDVRERELERGQPIDGWRLERYDRRAARYADRVVPRCRAVDATRP